MENARLEVSLAPLDDKPSAYGLEEVEFLISTNPGQPARALNKIASGGELSRISLAIQVVTAQTSARPTLVFDEVDVGIRSEEHTSELQSRGHLVCRLLLEKKKNIRHKCR